jgi:2-keto-3-deoxy-6-phosphogluconate aldolase
MTGAEVSDQLARHGVIPVITLDHPRQAGPLDRALVAGGAGVRRDHRSAPPLPRWA